ncbi:MAG: response regulator transcription factor [Bacteroidia bacterium]|nr:response regulator transcription factor [Bacteroidia bacterium]
MNAIIIEDEPKSADVLRKLLKISNPEIAVIAIASNVKDALKCINELQPDLVFMDIELPDGTGFDVIEKLEFKNFSLIFTTAYDSFAVRAFKYNAIDYLLKPIDVEELDAAIKKISTLSKLTTTRVDTIVEAARNNTVIKKITLPTGTAYEIIALEDIIRCEADTSYTKFFLKDGKRYIVSNSLKHYEDLLPPEKFIRIHHHHLINIDHVVRILKEDGGYAIMSDDSKIEISRRKKENLFECLHKL